jgi:hypothetical protein
VQVGRPTGDQVLEQLKAVGCFQFIHDYIVGPISVAGTCELRMVAHVLRKDARFIEGFLHWLHVDVGPNRTDFRSVKGSVGVGSLQVVVDLKSGRFYSDVDGWNPYQDLVNWIGHTVSDVFGVGKKRGDHA